MDNPFVSSAPPRAVKTALTRLEEAGFEAYLVGGCVRDVVLGQIPKDYDLTTSALPEEIETVFADFPLIETGLRHGTVTVLLEGMPLEITTYRVDGAYSDHRRPDSVRFTRSLAEDLARRDFTVNAMALSPNGVLSDPFGGQEDLRRGVIRCVGEPDRRFREDALRILRALRFSSVLGFDIDKETAESLQRNRFLLRSVAMERICTEWKGLLCGKGAQRVLTEYAEALRVFFPELPSAAASSPEGGTLGVPPMTSRTVGACPPVFTLRMAVLLRAAGILGEDLPDAGGAEYSPQKHRGGTQNGEKILRRLKVDNSAARRILTLIENYDMPLPRNEWEVRRALNRLSEPVFRHLIQLRQAEVAAGNPVFVSDQDALAGCEALLKQVLETGQCYRMADLKINGDDLIASGMTPGKEIGDTLKFLLGEVLEGRMENRQQALLSAAAKLHCPE